MALSYSFSREKDLLIVKTSGIDENLKEVMEYGSNVILEVKKHSITKLLCDERELIYNLRPIDTFQLAESLAEHTPGLCRAAVVCNPKYLPDAKFWETVSVNRGLNVAVFSSISEAEKWLNLE